VPYLCLSLLETFFMIIYCASFSHFMKMPLNSVRFGVEYMSRSLKSELTFSRASTNLRL
jgi:hypothetical protein